MGLLNTLKPFTQFSNFNSFLSENFLQNVLKDPVFDPSFTSGFKNYFGKVLELARLQGPRPNML
jgi:hypothetical protein